MKTFEIIPRSKAAGLYDYRYTIQTQAKAGNWVDSASVHEPGLAQAFAANLHSNGNVVRILDNHA